MIKKTKKKIVLFTAIACMFFTATIFSSAAADKWQGIADGDILVKDTVTKLSNSITEHEVITNNSEGNDQRIDYLCEIKPSDTIKIKAGYGKDNANSWSLTPTTAQAAAYEKNHPGHTVVAAINADFFDMGNGQPLGALVMEGKKYNDANGKYYFGVTKDGKAVIRNDADLSDLDMAVGGESFPLVIDGQPSAINSDFGDIRYSRTAIGIKEDGTVVTLVTYGHLPPISNGRSYKELGEMFAKAGCVTALALDGGGSATYAGRPEGSSKLEVRNHPGDGAERAVSSSVLIVSTEVPTGEFSHAQMTPNNEIYTPESSIQFEAKGVDTAGFPMELPQDVYYKLADDSKDLGTIDSKSGKFTANKSTGIVTVNLIQGDKTIGETSVEIVIPDKISFASDEISLGFEETSDLGISVKSKDRNVNFKAGDIKWTIANDKMGSFNGNEFTSSDGESLEGMVTATCTYDESVSGSIKVIVGKLPTVVWDFEDIKDESGNVVTKAEDYYIGTTDKPGILSHSNYNRGGKESLEIADIQNEDPVMKGSKSLKLNYDFRECGEVTEGACIGTTDSLEIPGVPTGIGVWVYAPEDVGIKYEGEGTQAGFWLRGYVADGSGKMMPYDFTLEPKVVTGDQQPGIYWEGWKYLEADLTKIQAPYKILPGMTLRLMFVAGTKMGTRTADSIYFDNLQFVYGTNIDDTDNPVIDPITLNGNKLVNDATINENNVMIEAYYRDIQNKYTSGIDSDTLRVYIDGENTVNNDKYSLNHDSTKMQLSNLRLSKGQHRLTIAIRDKFGNETTETRDFVVESGDTEVATTVKVVHKEDKAVLGGFVNLQIKASDDTVESSTTGIRVGSNAFSEYEVIASENYSVESKYTKSTKTITVKADNKTGTAIEGNDLIATVKIKIPTTLKEGDKFTYSIRNGKFTTLSGYYDTYATKDIELPVAAAYNISSDVVMVGGPDGVITVKKADDSLAAGVQLYVINDDGSTEEFGKTDENGQLKTNKFNAQAGTYVIYAQDSEGALSFQYKLQSYDAEGDENGMPATVRFNATKTPATSKNITWLSNPLHEGKQVIKYRVLGGDAWETVEADTVQKRFVTGGNKAANINGVKLTGLSPKTTYEYQLGTEGAFTETAQFTTDDPQRTESKFFLIGDIQNPDKTNLQNIVNKLKAEKYNFGVQIGDAIDNAADYDDWVSVGNLLGQSQLDDMDLLSVMGNHEYYGDGKAEIAAAMYNNENTREGGYYSVEYGNVYIATINFATTRSQIQEAANWLVKDARRSKAVWKILCTHQPPYYTNSSGGNDVVYELLPDAVENAGIDAVFSGHDHCVGRTNLIRDDKKNEAQGVVYYICGATGGKVYPITTQGKFDFDEIFKTISSDYGAIYLTASSNQDEMTIEIHDIVTSELIDSLTLEASCKKNDHNPIYDPETGLITCNTCGVEIEKYTGSVEDKDGNEYYFLNGTMKTGWVSVGEDWSYYDEAGIKEKVTEEIVQEKTCVKDSVKLFTSESGATKKIQLNDAGGHEYEDVNGKNICSVCGHERIKLEDCTVKIGIKDYTYSGKERRPIITLIAPNGEELTNSGNGRDFQYKYENNIEVGIATATLEAVRVGKYVNINDWRGNCEGTLKVNYTIHPDLPKSVYLMNNKTSATLSWKEAQSADKYVIYQSVNNSTFKEIGTTAKTSYVVKSMNSKNTYRFRIGTRSVVEGKTYDSIKKAVPTNVKPVISVTHKASDGKPVIKWTPAVDGAKYQVYRSLTGKADTFKSLAKVDKSPYVDVSATYGKTYYYKIKVTMPNSTNYVYSNVSKASSICSSPSVTASNRASDGKPVLKWEKVSYADKYAVYRSASKNGTYKWISSVKQTTYTDTSVYPGKTYYYKVRGIDNGIKGSLSNAVAKSCREGILTVTGTTRIIDGKPVVSWNEMNGAEKYQVYRADSKAGTYRWLWTGKGTKLANVNVEPEKTYYYKVRAIYVNGCKGKFSEPKAITCKSWKLEGSTREDGKPVITWDKQSGAVKYYVYRSITGEKGTFKKIFETKGTKFTNTSTTKGKTYYYKVRPVDKNGKSGVLSDIVKIVCE